MTLNRKSQGQGHRERSQFWRSHQGLFPCKVSSLYWLMWPRTNLNTEVNQNVERRTDRQTDGHHQSISPNCFAIRPKSINFSSTRFKVYDIFIQFYIFFHKDENTGNMNWQRYIDQLHVDSFHDLTYSILWYFVKFLQIRTFNIS